MILNDATLLSKNIDGVECSTMREFVSKLVKAKDLSMKVFVNSKLVCAGPACLNIDNNWIIASTNALVSYTDTVITDSIIVKIMQGDVELFESVTPCNAIIPAKDAVATFYVCLTSNTPYNELSKRVPHSVFRSRPIAKLTPVEFDKITAGLNPGGDIIVDDDNIAVTVHLEPFKEGQYKDGDDILTELVWDVSSPLSFWLKLNEFPVPNGDSPVITFDGEHAIQSDSESNQPEDGLYQFIITRDMLPSLPENGNTYNINFSWASNFVDHPVTPNVPTVTRVNVWPQSDNYVFNVMFNSLSDVSNIAYTINYEQAPVSGGTGSSTPSGNNIYFSLPIEDSPDIRGLIEYTSEGDLELDLEIHDLYDNPVDTITLSPADGISEWYWFSSTPEDG